MCVGSFWRIGNEDMYELQIALTKGRAIIVVPNLKNASYNDIKIIAFVDIV